MEPKLEIVEDPIFRLPIAQKAHELRFLVLKLHDLMPKRYRGYLWRDMYQQAAYVMYQIIKALKSNSRTSKRQSLERANEQLGMLQSTTFLVLQSQAISRKLYQETADLMNALGPMLGSFIRSMRT